MAFYLNDFKAHLTNLAKSVEVTDHTDPRQFKHQAKKNTTLEESYKNMKRTKTSGGMLREIRSY